MSRPSFRFYPLAFAFAAFYWGLPALTIVSGLLMIWGMVSLLRGYRFYWQPGAFFALILLGIMVWRSAWLHAHNPQIEFHFHWILLLYLLPMFSCWGQWQPVHLHRALLLGSTPGLIWGVWQLLKPAELQWAMQIGFHMYPRAEGLLSNPIMLSEGLLVVACWSFARLRTSLPRWERNAIWVHIIWSLLIIIFSRVRAGLLGFIVLFFLVAFFDARLRKWALALLLVLTAGFALSLQIFGFNFDSIEARVEIYRVSWDLFCQHPLLGIGSHAFRAYTDVGIHSHNTLLGMAVENGVIGLAIYGFWMVYQVHILWRLWLVRKQKEDQAWVVTALVLVFLN
ncbi:MAG: O-antigen ligase family protein, partial [Acidobacteria bacterium]|nr:O-antigen ligase family protein [Acidobacteriota bacterium]